MFARDITGSPSFSESVDNERLIGDSNKISCSRDRKGVPEGDAGATDLKSAPRVWAFRRRCWRCHRLYGMRIATGWDFLKKIGNFLY